MPDRSEGVARRRPPTPACWTSFSGARLWRPGRSGQCSEQTQETRLRVSPMLSASGGCCLRKDFDVDLGGAQPLRPQAGGGSPGQGSCRYLHRAGRPGLGALSPSLKAGWDLGVSTIVPRPPMALGCSVQSGQQQEAAARTRRPPAGQGAASIVSVVASRLCSSVAKLFSLRLLLCLLNITRKTPQKQLD